MRDKARVAGCSTNSYVRAAALGSDYRAPHDPALVQVLLALNLEMTRQGTNFNQIARRLNAGLVSDGDTLEQLHGLALSMRRTHRVIRAGLAGGYEPDEA